MLPVRLAAIPVPWDSTPLRSGRGMFTASFGDGHALSRVSHWLSPPACAGSGVSTRCGAVCSVSAADGHRVCAGEGQEGPLYPGCPCAWAAEGPGAGGGQRLSAC